MIPLQFWWYFFVGVCLKCRAFLDRLYYNCTEFPICQEKNEICINLTKIPFIYSMVYRYTDGTAIYFEEVLDSNKNKALRSKTFYKRIKKGSCYHFLQKLSDFIIFSLFLLCLCCA